MRRKGTAILALLLALALLGTGTALGEGTVTVPPGGTAVVDPEGEGTPTSAETASGLPGGFSDVPAGAWYADYVNIASQKGLLQGVGGDCYAPDRTVTLAQVVALVARIYASEYGGPAPGNSAQGPWYGAAYLYCTMRGLILEEELSLDDLERVATRFEVVDLLDRAVPEVHKPPINQIYNWDLRDLSEDSIPYGPVVYKWRRAGIIQGDQNGSFHGSWDISRAELAAIICRLTQNSPRVP